MLPEPPEALLGRRIVAQVHISHGVGIIYVVTYATPPQPTRHGRLAWLVPAEWLLEALDLKGWPIEAEPWGTSVLCEHGPGFDATVYARAPPAVGVQARTDSSNRRVVPAEDGRRRRPPAGPALSS
jgi:hypothetical protein